MFSSEAVEVLAGLTPGLAELGVDASFVFAEVHSFGAA
jgi:hypothetical protein